MTRRALIFDILDNKPAYFYNTKANVNTISIFCQFYSLQANARCRDIPLMRKNCLLRAVNKRRVDYADNGFCSGSVQAALFFSMRK
ncbi:hypothetical protein EPYR_02746 [Erwinia pyrifoliae DSM 12163]|nr:hypothetical protein EPYR_02746 [Erwinia pyrifoliae DSM 12163]